MTETRTYAYIGQNPEGRKYFKRVKIKKQKVDPEPLPPNFPEKIKPKEEITKSPMAPTIGTWDPTIDMPLGGAKDD